MGEDRDGGDAAVGVDLANPDGPGLTGGGDHARYQRKEAHEGVDAEDGPERSLMGTSTGCEKLWTESRALSRALRAAAECL
jgi:hypothetical protein